MARVMFILRVENGLGEGSPGLKMAYEESLHFLTYL